MLSEQPLLLVAPEPITRKLGRILSRRNGAASPPTKHRSPTSAPVSQAVVGLQVQGTFRNSGLDDYVDVPISSRRPGRA